MKRFRRWAFTAAAIVSVALFALVCAAWWRSYTVCPSVDWTCLEGRTDDYRVRQFGMTLCKGGILFEHLSSWASSPDLNLRFGTPLNEGWKYSVATFQPWYPTGLKGFSQFGFFLGHTSIPGPPIRLQATSVVLPMWFLALATAALPAVWIVRRVRTRRQRLPGHCRRCGYDLRGSPERCPECGENVALQPAIPDEPEA